MIFAVGVVGITYLVTKVYEKYSASQKTSAVVDLANQPSPEQGLILANSTQEITDTLAIEKQQAQRYLTMSGVSMGLAILASLYPPLTLVWLGAFTYTAIPVIKQFEKSLFQEKKIDGYVLYLLADALTLALGYYFTASFAVGLFHTSKVVIANAQEHSQHELLDVFKQQPPSTVWVLKDQVEIEVPLDAVALNDKVVVNTGEMIPVDGLILQGRALVDQHNLTGESQPTEKCEGDSVFASTIVVRGRLVVQVEKSGPETTVSKIHDILTQTAEFKTQKQLKGEKWADTAILPILGVAGVSWPLLGPVGSVVILNSHISGIIRLIAPLGTLNHLTLAAHQGILMKDGRALESITEIDTILFDKTGTLTYNEPEVGQIIVCNPFTVEEILAYTVVAERRLNHPIANAILQKAEEYHLALPAIDDSDYQLGYGITMRFDSLKIRVGSARFMIQEGVIVPEHIKTAMVRSHTEGHSLVMVAINNQIGGAIEIRATVRPDAAAVIQGLRQRGVKHIAIVSGDHKQATKQLARCLGIDNYYYDILPQDKAMIVEQLQREGKKVCFVGDGVNDAIAMQKADISVSFRGAATVATDVAQVVLLDGNLADLPRLFDLSKQLDVNLRNSLLINTVPGVIIFVGAFLQIGIPVAVAISGVSLLVGVGNAMLPLRQLEEKNTGRLD